MAATILLTAALVAPGCGNTDPGTATDATASSTSRSVVPRVAVIDVSTGEPVGLTERVSTSRPTLLWMWAPT
jgi:hypothetical protein